MVNRASDADTVELVRACRSARDRLIVLLMARAGLRRGEACGLRRSDLHLLVDSRQLGCDVPRAHLHVVRRDNPNGAWAKSRRQRSVPLDFLVVQAFDAYDFERSAIPRAHDSDFVLVNLFGEPIGAPMRPDAVNELLNGCSRRAGLDRDHRATPAPARLWEQHRRCRRNPRRGGRATRPRIDEFLPGLSASRSGSLRDAVERVIGPREQANR